MSTAAMPVLPPPTGATSVVVVKVSLIPPIVRVVLIAVA
jgi:hypothetical protein